MLWSFAFLAPFNSHNLQGRFIILLRIIPRKPDRTMILFVSCWCLLWRKAWNFWHQWSGITWLFQRRGTIPSLFGFFSQTFSFAVNSTTELLELFSGVLSITTSLPTTNTLISSSVPSFYLLWVTWLHRDHGGGRGWWERYMPNSQLKPWILPIQP